MLFDRGSCRGGQLMDSVFHRPFCGHWEGRVDLDEVAPVRSAVYEGGDHWTTGHEGEAGCAGGCPRFSPEKGDEDPGEVANVLVDQQPIDLIGFEACKELAARVFAAMNDFAAESRSEVCGDGVDPRVVHLAHRNAYWDACDSQHGVEQLPISGVPCDHHRSLPGLQGPEEVFFASDVAQGREIPGVGMHHPCNFPQDFAEVEFETFPQVSTAVDLHLREGDLEVFVFTPSFSRH